MREAILWRDTGLMCLDLADKLHFGDVMKKIIFGTIIAAIMMFSVNVFAEDDLKEAHFCSFVIPPEFTPSEEAGLFINKNHPMESSTIRYSVYYNGLDVVLTNREKAALSEHNEPKVTDKSTELTKEIYQETISAAYNSEYGEDVGYSVSSFDKINIDGYPGYRIEADFQASEQERVYQTVYMLLSKYRTFTVTFQRAEDDDCQDVFSECQSTINIQ